ncbi:ParA family protein [Paramagnetospirillum magneticum]|uniref:ParA family protein n=1 Tax=Paramagnetospirillum magneticum TaxID=84159 RepID=UPI000A02773D|nr:ParA family protein [Paramagnetospirillum magneticum]
MKIITFASQKGGVSKTTTAFCVAADLARRGGRVAAIDSDSQGSLALWAKGRPVDRPQIPVAAVSPQNLKAAIDVARKDRYDWLVIDTPPTGAPLEVETAYKHSDLIVIPVTPSAIDIAASGVTVKLARQLRRPFIILISLADPKLSGMFERSWVAEARRELNQFGTLYPGCIVKRRAYQRAFMNGLGVSEMGDDAAAQREISQLTDWIIRQVNSEAVA